MEGIVSYFNDYFSNWDILLPAEAVANRQRGKIVQAGWTIWWLFDADESGEYLDFYAMHRMTNDRHHRVYEDGRTVGLDTVAGMRRVSRDPEEDERLEAEFWAHNERVNRELEAKGFGIRGDEHPSAVINRALLSSREQNRRLRNGGN